MEHAEEVLSLESQIREYSNLLAQSKKTLENRVSMMQQKMKERGQDKIEYNGVEFLLKSVLKNQQLTREERQELREKLLEEENISIQSFEKVSKLPIEKYKNDKLVIKKPKN